ncbi:MAG: hypothetical protein ACJ73S_24005 [Mycobacteriales bacterium]
MTADVPELLAADREVLYDVRQVPPAAGYRLLLPSNWRYVDIRPGRSAKSIRLLVEERIRRNPELAEYRKQLLGLFRAAANDALAHDVERLAMLMESVRGRALAASLTVARAAGAEDPGGGEISNHPDALLAAARQLADEGSERALPASDLEIDLVAGTQQVLVRSVGVRVGRDPRTGHTAESFQAQYWIPEPGTSDAVVLTFASPNGGAAVEPLTALFDLVALSFVWHWPTG